MSEGAKSRTKEATEAVAHADEAEEREKGDDTRRGAVERE